MDGAITEVAQILRAFLESVGVTYREANDGTPVLTFDAAGLGK